MTDGAYSIRLTGRARRALAEALPLTVVAAVVEFLDGPLAAEPYRVGKPLQAPLDGRYAARRGTYRVIYQVDEKTQTVTVEQIAHRRAAYRP